jgi:L-alanine-DL-glutamate epimerase-like enolase superfamily enzyme
MIEVTTRIERWELIKPFATARDCHTHVSVLVTQLTDNNGVQGWSEAMGVDYDGETPESIKAEVEALKPMLHEQIGGDELLGLLPAGGARNALDCALWDLRAKQSGRPVWQLAGLAPPRPVMTVYTIGLASEADFRCRLHEARGFPSLKLKVDADHHLDLVRMTREIHPAACILVDANQSWSRPLLERLLPALAELGVALVEQPVRREEDASLDGLRSPLPLAADESCTDRQSLRALAGRYQYINIKLDKCGGLTEALVMCGEARRLGLGLMVGNMCGSSLAMAPAFLVAQSCAFTDLDGPLLQKLDRASPIRFESGWMQPPEAALWG